MYLLQYLKSKIKIPKVCSSPKFSKKNKKIFLFFLKFFYKENIITYKKILKRPTVKTRTTLRPLERL